MKEPLAGGKHRKDVVNVRPCGDGSLTKVKQPRVYRYPLVAAVELTDLHSAAQLRAETSDLGLRGCNVKTNNVWTAGTMVRISITHGRSNFAAFGRVVYSRAKFGMGIVFTQKEPIDCKVLDRWIAEFNSKKPGQ